MNSSNGSRLWVFAQATILALIIAGFLSAQSVEAQGIGNPDIGYDSSTSYFLNYTNDTSFGPGNSSDVQVSISVDGGAYNDIDVDTGSRGLYESSDLLPTDFLTTASGTYPGQIQLTSSGRIFQGAWVPTTVTFNNVTGTSNGTLTASPNVLDVTTLGAEKTTTYSVSASDGTAIYLGSPGTITGSVTAMGGSVTLSPGQLISYANNPDPAHPGKSLIGSFSNFGIGFDLNGNGTGPIGNNQNQIYNALININPTVSGTYVQGYVVTPTGIQLGLTGTDTGYAYTNLSHTQFTSTNSQPDWQTPLGQTTLNGTTNHSGSVVIDSGIPNAYISAPGLSGTITSPITVSLLNSGVDAEGLPGVGYKIDLTDTGDFLNPTPDPANNAGAVQVSVPTGGIYTQNMSPYGDYYLNTGRNVFNAFDMLYDAQNGYMGLIPNQFADDLPAGDLIFTPGYYADPIPEPASQSTAIILLGLSAFILRSLQKTRTRRLPANLLYPLKR